MVVIIRGAMRTAKSILLFGEVLKPEVADRPAGPIDDADVDGHHLGRRAELLVVPTGHRRRSLPCQHQTDERQESEPMEPVHVTPRRNLHDIRSR
jgi:hypothetical protein